MHAMPLKRHLLQALAPVALLFLPLAAAAQIDVGTVGTPVDGTEPCNSGTIYSCSACGGNAWTVTGITQCEAATADTFSISWSNPNTTPSTACVNFANATSVATLASQLNCVAGLSVQHGGGGTINFVSPFLTTITNITLTAPGVTGTSSMVDISGVDALAGAADTFTLDIDGVGVDPAPADFSQVTGGSSLAAELDNIVGIDVSYSATAEGTLSIVASSQGAAPFSNISLTAPIAIFSDGFESGDLSAWTSSAGSQVFFAGDLWASGSVERASAVALRDRNGSFPGQEPVQSGQIVVFRFGLEIYILSVTKKEPSGRSHIEVRSVPVTEELQFDATTGAVDRSEFDRWIRGL